MVSSGLADEESSSCLWWSRSGNSLHENHSQTDSDADIIPTAPTRPPPHPQETLVTPTTYSVMASADFLDLQSDTWQRNSNKTGTNSLAQRGICQKSVVLVGVGDPANTCNADAEQVCAFSWGVGTSAGELAACLDPTGIQTRGAYGLRRSRATAPLRSALQLPHFSKTESGGKQREVSACHRSRGRGWASSTHAAVRTRGGPRSSPPPRAGPRWGRAASSGLCSSGLPNSWGWSQHSCSGQPLPVLGCALHNNLSWNDQIEHADEAHLQISLMRLHG